MPFESLRSYIDVLRAKDLVVDVRDADWDKEIGALTEVVALSKRPRTLMFDPVQGFAAGRRVVTNLYVSPRLQAVALGLPDDAPGVEVVAAWREISKGHTKRPPRFVDDGPIRENVQRGDDVDLMQFPTPFWHEFDGGRYFGTGCVVITNDPQEHWVNLAPYRAQLHDAKTLGLMISPGHHGWLQMEKYWARGEDAPVVVVAGQDPHTYAAACMPAKWGESEYDIAGAFAGAPIDVIVEPRTGLPIPATAEIAVIGFVPALAKEGREEGPFGECTGYYTGHGPALVVRVEEIWHRNDPILQGSPTMHGSAMMHSLGAEIFTSAIVWDSVEREVPGVVGVYSLYQPCQAGSYVLVVAIKQRFPGHAKQAALAALASHGTIFMNKSVIVVDEDVDPADLNDVLFAVTTRCNPAEDIDIIRGIPGTFLDPRIPPERRAASDSTTSTMLINACRPYTWRDQFPRVNIIGNDLKAATLAKWGAVVGLA
ncbi:MAG: UbiD family decarboxylase [Candidatus Velthaea sp.]